jgi:signal transduction histidine kinase
MNSDSMTVRAPGAARARAERSIRRPRLRALPLRIKLPLLLVGYLAVFLTISLAFTRFTLVRLTEASVAARLENAARQVALSAETSMEQRRTREAAAAQLPAVRAALHTGSQTDDVITALTPLSMAPLPVELIGIDGRVVARVGERPAEAVDPPRTDADGQFLVGPLFEAGANTLAWSVAAVRDGPRTIGHVASLMRIAGPADASDRIAGLTGEVITLHIRNADGSMWSRAPSAAGAAPVARVLRDDILYFDRDDGRTIAAEHAVAGTPFVTVLETPLSSVHASVRRTLRPLVLVSLLLVGLGVLIAWLLSRSVTRPIGDVAHAVAGLSSGDYRVRVGVHGEDEIGSLAAGVNRMAAELERARRELIRRVHEANEARLDAERLRADAELARGAAEEARVTAERASQAKSDFLAVMSHELRTPLNAIGGYSQLLEMGVHGQLNDAQRAALARIDHNQAHLLRLINDVLSYSRLDAGYVQYTLAAIPVSDVLRELDLMVAPQVAAQRIALHIDLPDPGIALHADRDKLLQILLNLVTNAIKFTGAGGRIDVACTHDAEHVRIHVHDTGIGIAADRLDAIFDPFFQADRSLSNPAEGVGLGLAISRDLARGMGGDIVVTSERGSGSTFTVALPRAAA